MVIGLDLAGVNSAWKLQLGLGSGEGIELTVEDFRLAILRECIISS